MERGKFTTSVFVILHTGEIVMATYVVDNISLEEAKYAVNHEIFSHGKWETITNTVYL